MKDYSSQPEYNQRHMVTGYFNDAGRIVEIQGFYCMNGPDVDGQYNIEDGAVISPGPGNLSPYYFVPEVGVATSVQNIHAKRRDAVKEARRKLEDERDRIDDLLEALND